jgi:hypothetical protein
MSTKKPDASKVEAPAAASPAVLSDLQKLQQLVDNMSEEDRQKLAQAGVAVPQGDLTAMSEGRHDWGLRCTDCGKIALYFVGTKWTFRDQVVTDEPPPLPHYEIAWMQDLPPSEIDRHTPRCQHCAVPVRMNSDDTFNRERRRIVRLSDWTDSRDKRYDTRAAAKNNAAASLGASQAQLGDSQDFTARLKPTSDVIVAQTGDPSIKDQLEAVAGATGMTAIVSGKA